MDIYAYLGEEEPDRRPLTERNELMRASHSLLALTPEYPFLLTPLILCVVRLGLAGKSSHGRLMILNIDRQSGAVRWQWPKSNAR